MESLMEAENAPEQQLHESEYEVLELREKIAMLTKLFYQDRQQWLEEKRRLQNAAKLSQGSKAEESEQAADLRGCPSPRHQRVASDIKLGSEAGSEAAGEDVSQAGVSAREPLSSFSSSRQSTRSTSPNQTASAAGSTFKTSVSGSNAELVTELQRQLVETRQAYESASVRWTLEREALQRQIHALLSMSGAEASGGPAAIADGLDERATTHASLGPGEEQHERAWLSERVSELETMVNELQAERDNLEEQLRVLADATRSRRATHGSVDSAAAPEVTTPRSSAPAGTPPAAPPGAAGSFHALTLRDSVSVADLLAEKADLERELRLLREDSVAVPRAEYAELSSLRSQMAFLKSEMEQLREEAEEAVQLRVAAEGELAQVLQGCVPVPHEDYQRLLRLEAEGLVRDAAAAADAAASRTSASAPASVSDSSGLESIGGSGAARAGADEEAEEYRRLLAAAEQERDVLEDQLAALQRRVELSEAEAERAAEARGQAEVVAAAAVGMAADASAVADGGGASADDVNAIQSELAALRDQLEASVGASVAESSRLAAKVAELQEELEALRGQNTQLRAESSVVRQALASGQAQASGEARAAAAAAEQARASAAAELLLAQRRIAELEGELGAAREALDAALAERERCHAELAATQEAALRTSEALASCLHSRYEADGAAAEGEAAEAPLSEARARVQTLEDELLAVRQAASSAEAERNELLREAEGLRRELADSLAACGAAEAEAAAAVAASAAAIRELASANRALDATKLELAEARELGLLFQSKRDVLYPTTRRAPRGGLPPEWLFGPGVAAARSGGGGGTSSGETPRTAPRVSSVSESVSEEMEGTEGGDGGP